MKTFNCICQNSLFFENSRCVQCHREVGWCPVCDRMSALVPIAREAAIYACGQPDCRAQLVKCHNYSTHQVCNRCIELDNVTESDQLCDYCRFNATVPDLSVEGNLLKWARLEAAKRRLLYILDFLGLPYGTAADGFSPPLAFAFKGDVILKDESWRTLGQSERVYTGHADGKITINIREADDVEREKLRVDMNESHRTLVGHFHHEIGHYYWQALVKGEWCDRFKALFGDPENPDYSEAMDRYYKSDPPAAWQENYISAYATMHPWEDFAETFAAYLDMVSVLDTALNSELKYGLDIHTSSLKQMVTHYQKLGIMLNEFNRTLGLLDFVPDVFTPPVVEKINFVHELIHDTTAL